MHTQKPVWFLSATVPQVKISAKPLVSLSLTGGGRCAGRHVGIRRGGMGLLCPQYKVALRSGPEGLGENLKEHRAGTAAVPHCVA